MTVSVMLVFLYVFDLTTNLMPGINEITIPTMALPDDKDLGQVVHLTLQHSRGALMDIVGLATLVVSAALTAKAIRRGTAAVLQSEDADHVHTFQFRNLVIGAGLALVVLASWLLVFVTAIRSSAIRTVLGSDITSAQVTAGKTLVVVLTWVLLTSVLFVPLHSFSTDQPAKTVLLASAVFGAFVVAINFVLLYSYIAALFDPDSSGGVVLVLTLLAWVNLAARGLFLTECWIRESGDGSAD